MPRSAHAAAGHDTQQRILEAALEAFSERGYDGAKTRDIAARANVTLGLLQYHFGGKLPLWKAAVDLAFAELRAGLGALLDDPGPADDRARLRLLVRSYVHFVARKPEFVRLMHEEGKRRGPRMRWLVDRHVKPLYGALRPLVERCQQAGVLPEGVAPDHYLYALIGAVGIIFHQAEECRRVAGFDPTEPSAVEAHARACEILLVGPPEEESPR